MLLLCDSIGKTWKNVNSLHIQNQLQTKGTISPRDGGDLCRVTTTLGGHRERGTGSGGHEGDTQRKPERVGARLLAAKEEKLLAYWLGHILV